MKIVAVIDDGLNHYSLRLDSPYIEYEVINGKVERTAAVLKKCDSHGLICAKIIEKYCHERIMFISVRIKNDSEENGLIADLVTAVKFCTNLKVDVMSISLGTTGGFGVFSLKRAISNAITEGIIVVCALSNDGTVSLPAAMKNVIAVRANVRGLGGHIIHVQDAKHGEVFEVWPENAIVTVNGDEMYFAVSNSYACPVITARVIELMDSAFCRKRVDDVTDKLRQCAYIKQKRG